MQAKTMIPVLLLIAIAGCARSADVPGATGPAGSGASEASGRQDAQASAAQPAFPAPQEQAQTPANAGSQAPSAGQAGTASGSGSAGGTQGIRVGEPAPGDPRGPQQPEPGAGWHAFGNEPFWSVQARGGTLVFTTPDDQNGVTLLGRRVPSLVGTVILGSGPKGEFHFGVTPGDCSDGMSDRTHAFHSTFSYGGTTYEGCAEPVDAR